MGVLMTVGVAPEDIAGDAGSLILDLGMSIIAGLAPLVVTVVLARVAIARVAAMLGFSDATGHRYRDEHWSSGESWDPDSGQFHGEAVRDGEARAYTRRAGKRRRRYERGFND